MWRHDRVRWREKEREREGERAITHALAIQLKLLQWFFTGRNRCCLVPPPPPPVKLLCLATPTWQIAWQWQKVFQLNLCANKVKFCATVFVVLLAQKPRKSFNNLATLTNCPSAVIIYGSEWVVLLAPPLSKVCAACVQLVPNVSLDWPHSRTRQIVNKLCERKA